MSTLYWLSTEVGNRQVHKFSWITWIKSNVGANADAEADVTVAEALGTVIPTEPKSHMSTHNCTWC